ncbi:hypothetical protein EII29_07650 [Leptotrichia sp. OH3620_COT-345]|uniref:hypothetical protein n=1 Tax=Leptotrichia sp. OH3620_COT-345 TaxID=2491048 RepID=UPI000F64ABD5|nr:hypothetical protein [Leptotrichia sp. OH3620_COT-345]RRD39272.1 hypothetical protein EII29_07650 [Leptotrichia sp. OH3620_COT-345]
MQKIKVYFMEITDLNGQKHQIKSLNYEEIFKFQKRHKGKVAGIHKGRKLVTKEKLKEIKTEHCFK